MLKLDWRVLTASFFPDMEIYRVPRLGAPHSTLRQRERLRRHDWPHPQEMAGQVGCHALEGSRV